MQIGVIYLLGAIHGVILALILYQKKVNELPNKLLALLMVVFSIDLGMAAFQSFGLHESYPHFIGLDYPVTLLYGPLVFLYVKTLRDGRMEMEALDYLHFGPFIILLGYMIPFFTGSGAEKLALLNNANEIHSTYKFGFINHVKVLHGLTYVGCVIYLLITYRRKIKETFSSIEKINLNWLRNLVLSITLVAGAAGILHLLSSLEQTILMGLSSGIYDDLTLLASTVFVYSIGYMGLHQPEVFEQSSQNSPQTIEGTTLTDKHKSQDKEIGYQKSGLDQEKAEWYSRRLIEVMEQEKLYRNSDLNLGNLADELDVSTHNLTEVINRYIRQNFYDFVNSYRINEVKQRLKNPESESLTLLSIGLEAGFNSKSTFNSVFKKQTGMTPSQFRDQYSGKQN